MWVGIFALSGVWLGVDLERTPKRHVFKKEKGIFYRTNLIYLFLVLHVCLCMLGR